MKLDPRELPPSVPPDVVKRIVALQNERDALRWWTVVGMVLFVVASIFVVVASAVKKFPPWAPLLPTTLIGVMGAIGNLTSSRKLHRVLVELGFTCPKCQAAMFRDTWSTKQQEAERESLYAGRCPRCFETVDWNLSLPGRSTSSDVGE
jgi:hypothetical protein